MCSSRAKIDAEPKPFAPGCRWRNRRSAWAGRGRTVRYEGFANPVAFDQHSHGLSHWAWLGRSDNSGSWTAWIQFPILAVFLAVAVPTLLVWRLCPKPAKPGHCRCGYDLHGNESGVCPECGIEVQA